MIRRAKIGYIVCSVLFCLVGVLLAVYPDMSALTLCYLLGAVLVLCGLTKIVGYFSHDLYNLAFQFDLALGIFVSAVGIIMLVYPKKVLTFLAVLIGLFVLIDGVFKCQTSLDAKRFGLPNWWLILLGSLLCAALGILLILDPFGGSNVLMIFIGVSLIVDGAQNLFNALYTVKIIKRAGGWNPKNENNDFREV